MARELAAEGAHVVAGARTVAPLEQIERVTPFAVDLTSPDGPARLVGHAVERHGRVDVLVNNVGGARLRLDGFLSTTDADFQASLELNFFSALRATRAAVAAMIERGEGTIVNVASVNAFFQPDGAVIDYGAAKAALLNVATGSRKNSRRTGSGLPASRRDRWRRTCGSATTASPRPSGARGASTPTRSTCTGNTADGVHIASCGGTWPALVAGFGGLRDFDGDVRLDSRLPAGRDRLRFRVQVRGQLVEVDLTHDAITLRVLETVRRSSSSCPARSCGLVPGAPVRRPVVPETLPRAA